MLHEVPEAFRAQVPAGEPGDHLDVAEPPGAAFDIRLEVVSRVVITAVALALFLGFRMEELRAAPHAIYADSGR